MPALAYDVRKISDAAEANISANAFAAMMTDPAHGGFRDDIKAHAPRWVPNVLHHKDSGLFGRIRRGKGRYRDLAEKIRHQPSPRPVTIVGAGPGARGQLEDISRETLIVSTDRMFGSLAEAGVRPHYVVVTDPKPRIAEFLAAGDSRGVDLIAPVYMCPSALAAWDGTVWFYSHARVEARGMWLVNALKGVSGVYGFLEAFGNVAGAAISFAGDILFHTELYLLGVEFSWETDFYADGALNELRPKRRHARIDNLGRTVYCSEIFERYASLMRSQMEQLNAAHGTRFHICSGGILNSSGLARNHPDLKTAYQANGIKPGRGRRV